MDIKYQDKVLSWIDTLTLDTITKTGYMYHASANPVNRDDIVIPIYNNVAMGFYVDIIMYEHPYIKTNISHTKTRIFAKRNGLIEKLVKFIHRPNNFFRL